MQILNEEQIAVISGGESLLCSCSPIAFDTLVDTEHAVEDCFYHCCTKLHNNGYTINRIIEGKIQEVYSDICENQHLTSLELLSMMQKVGSSMNPY